MSGRAHAAAPSLSLSPSHVPGTRRKGLPPRNYFLYKSEAIRFGVILPLSRPVQTPPVPPFSLARDVSLQHADKRGEKWLRFINDIFMDGKFSIFKKAKSSRGKTGIALFFSNKLLSDLVATFNVLPN